MACCKQCDNNEGIFYISRKSGGAHDTGNNNQAVKIPSEQYRTTKRIWIWGKPFDDDTCSNHCTCNDFCGFMLIYTVYFRFLKILVVVPFGALAFSTVSGNRMVSHSAVSYAKYFLSIVLEAVTMALAIIVCNAFLNAGLPTFTSDYADWTKALMYMCELTFSVAMTVGAVKGAQSLTSKALGL